MTDRHEDERGDGRQRAPGADAGREGFGDDGGTRVGRPDAARGADAGAGPSSQPVKEGLEGAVFEGGGRDSRGPRTANTGAGGEAAEGMHDAQGDRAPGDRSGVEEDDAGSTRGGQARRGSEPLEHREQEHKSGYGGEGGAPRTSSDQR